MVVQHVAAADCGSYRRTRRSGQEHDREIGRGEAWLHLYRYRRNVSRGGAYGRCGRAFRRLTYISWNSWLCRPKSHLPRVPRPCSSMVKTSRKRFVSPMSPPPHPRFRPSPEFGGPWSIKQREMGAVGSVVMEGRDIGSVVFPDARVKIFLDAPSRERVKRRRAGTDRRGCGRVACDRKSIGRTRSSRSHTRRSASRAGSGRRLRRLGRSHHRGSGRTGSEDYPRAHSERKGVLSLSGLISDEVRRYEHGLRRTNPKCGTDLRRQFERSDRPSLLYRRCRRSRICCWTRCAQPKPAGPVKSRRTSSISKTKHVETCRALLSGSACPTAICEIGILVGEFQRIAHGMLMLGERPPRSVDEAVATGERLSAMMIAAYLNCNGTRA